MLSELQGFLWKPLKRKLFILVSRMYESGDMTTDIKKTFKSGGEKCEYYIISLVSNANKVLTKKNYKRI